MPCGRRDGSRALYKEARRAQKEEGKAHRRENRLLRKAERSERWGNSGRATALQLRANRQHVRAEAAHDRYETANSALAAKGLSPHGQCLVSRVLSIFITPSPVPAAPKPDPMLQPPKQPFGTVPADKVMQAPSFEKRKVYAPPSYDSIFTEQPPPYSQNPPLA